MIAIYAPTETDFSSNGLGLLLPLECTVRERANGMYELTLVHPITPDLRWTQIQNGCYIKAEVPMRESPLYEADAYTGEESTTVQVTRKLYTVNVKTRLRLRAQPNTSSVILGRYPGGTQVVRLEDVGGGWYKVAIRDGGAVGYMYASYLRYEKDITDTITEVRPVTREGVTVLPAREQLFRINNVETDTEKRTVTATALHVFYELRGNPVASAYSPASTNANTVAREVFARALMENPFELHSHLSGSVTGEYGFKGLTECLLDPDVGILAQTGGVIVRDNYDIFLLPAVERDMGITIRRGKNLLGVTVLTDNTDAVMRIIPVGKTSDGEYLFLDGQIYVDSPRIEQFPTIYAKRIDYDVRVGDGEGEFPTVDAARAELRRLAALEFDNGIDLPAYGMEVDFVTLERSGHGANYASLQAVHMHDTVTVIDELIGLRARLRVTGYDWDVLAKRYTSVIVGELSSLEQTTYGYTLADGSVSGTKIIGGTVDGSALKSATIQYAKISVATIEKLAADAIMAIRAHINELVAGTVTTDQLYADLARIAIAQITTANITEANIDWAAIKTLTAEIAKISKASLKDADIEWADIENLNAAVARVADARIKNASITTAQISDLRAEIAKVITLSAQDGKFDFASIRDLLAKAMILEQGVAGSVYIKNLVATQASFVGATLGNLVLKGEDGKYYSVTVQSDGTIHTQQTTVTDTEISAGQTSDGRQIVATDANIANLNASTIKAESAIIADIYVGALTAGKISASEALIASATVPELYVTSIQAIGDSLDLSANKSIRLLLGSRNANHRGETPPTDANVNDLWTRPSTGYIYQRVAESEELPIFVVETEKGDLYYRYDDGITVYDLRMDASGDLYIDDKAPFAVSVNGAETMYWVRVKDSDIARVELLLTEDSIVATVRGSAAYQQDMERVDAAQGSADKAYGEAAKAQQDVLAAMNEIAAKAQEIIELETKITQLASEIELRVRQDDLSTYLKLLIEGVQIGRNDSEYNVLIANTGMFIRQFSDVIASFAKRQLTASAVRIANPADTGLRCVLRTAADGGMMMVSEEAIW